MATQKVGKYVVHDGTYYNRETDSTVIRVLEMARRTKQRIRVFYGDTTTGRDWMEEYDIMGTVGRSMGPVKVPLLIHNARSHGGRSLLEHCIVKITANGRVLYEHPKYHQGVFEISPVTSQELRDAGYTTSVLIDGMCHANFKSLIKAKRWIAFMKGETNRK